MCQMHVGHAGKLDVLVNNVGMNVRKPVLEYTMEDFHGLLNANLCSAFHLSQDCWRLLAQSPRASIVFISSVAGGPLAMKSGPAYAMSKGVVLDSGHAYICNPSLPD